MKTMTMKELDLTITLACETLRKECEWTDDECMRFAANFMENLVKDGWKVVEE